MKYTKQYEQGKKAEDLFIAQFGGTKSTPQQNRLEGWDILCKGLKIDVKSRKKLQRKHAGFTEYHWIELKNNYGNPGWLYKLADVFVFECEYKWLFVKKETLQAHVERHVCYELSPTPEPYKTYTRQGRKDLLTIVPRVDMVSISDKIITKNEHYRGSTSDSISTT